MLSSRYVIILVILGLFTLNSDSVKGAITADWGDIVNVRYSLYLDAAHQEPVSGNVDQPINNIYLSTGGTVPTNLEQLYPDTSASYLGEFKAAIVGMEIEQTKQVKIDAENAYTDDPSHQLYGKDLYFVITLLTIVYDAILNPTATTATTATTETSTNPIQDYTNIALIGGGIAVVAVGVIAWNFRTSRAVKSALSEKKTSTSIREQSIRKDKDQLKNLREITETFSSPKKPEEERKVKFQRRRR